MREVHTSATSAIEKRIQQSNTASSRCGACYNETMEKIRNDTPQVRPVTQLRAGDKLFTNRGWERVTSVLTNSATGARRVLVRSNGVTNRVDFRESACVRMVIAVRCYR